MTTPDIPLAVLGQLLFTMMGPIGLIPMFAGITAGADAPLRRRIAFRAFRMACIALALATLVGARGLESQGASPGALAAAAGLVLTLVSLRNVLALSEAGAGAQAAPAGPPPAGIAIMPLAFPTMVQPYGVGVLILFCAYFPDLRHQLSILGVALAIMTLNLGAMLAARRIMAAIGHVPLLILGAVLSILQVALGMQILASGLKMLARAG